MEREAKYHQPVSYRRTPRPLGALDGINGNAQRYSSNKR
jgi:hypothetical protein